MIIGMMLWLENLLLDQHISLQQLLVYTISSSFSSYLVDVVIVYLITSKSLNKYFLFFISKSKYISILFICIVQSITKIVCERGKKVWKCTVDRSINSNRDYVKNSRISLEEIMFLYSICQRSIEINIRKESNEHCLVQYWFHLEKILSQKTFITLFHLSYFIVFTKIHPDNQVERLQKKGNFYQNERNQWWSTSR